MKNRGALHPIPITMTLSAALVTLALAGCEPSELRPVPLGLPSGGGLAAPQVPAAPAAQPMAPPVLQSNQYDPSEYEIHGAVTAGDCYIMLARFLREGRKVRLVAVERNQANQGGGVLEWMCVFDGEDADPAATPFEDDRFPPNEYDYP